MTIGSKAATMLLQQLDNLDWGNAIDDSKMYFDGPFDTNVCDEFDNEQYRVDPLLPTLTEDDREYITTSPISVLMKHDDDHMTSVWYETLEEYYDNYL